MGSRMSPKKFVQCFLLIWNCHYLTVSVRGQRLKGWKPIEMRGYGRVRGVYWDISGHKVQVFKGIPYAEPPVNDLRFRKPVMKKSWSGTTLLTDFKPPCIQFMEYNELDNYAKDNMQKQNEDCLYLNIFGPFTKEGDTRRYPVLVWIHGGSFLAGSGDVSIDQNVTLRNIVFKGVVLVTINYRLGPLGFASYKGPDGYFKGNLGLWDMITALKWIKLYIRYFGGDPDSVTIMGESAGGAAASILAMSPVTEGLVHQAIIMSGSAAAGWGVHRGEEPPSWDVTNIIDHLKCVKTFDDECVSSNLRMAPKDFGIVARGVCTLAPSDFYCPDDVVEPEHLMDCLRKVNFSDPTFRKTLSVELSVSKAVVDGEIIPMSPEKMLKNFTRIPILTGVAVHEWGHKGMQFYNFKSDVVVNKEIAAEKIRGESLDSFAHGLAVKLPNSTLDLIGNASYFRYFASLTPNQSLKVEDFVYQLQKLEADIDFVSPCQREVMAYANSENPVYVYSWEHLPDGAVIEQESKMYNFFGTRKKVKYNRSTSYKAAFHGVDHAYIFTEGYNSQMVFNFTHKDKKLSDFLCTLFTNFVKFGNPTPNAVAGVVWPRYTSKKRFHLKLAIPSKVVDTDVNWEGANFWNQYVPYLTEYSRIDDPTSGNKYKSLTDEERLKMNAYQRAWYALWLLVAAIALLLWTVIICLVARKCISARSKPYNNIIVTNNR